MASTRFECAGEIIESANLFALACRRALDAEAVNVGLIERGQLADLNARTCGAAWRDRDAGSRSRLRLLRRWPAATHRSVASKVRDRSGSPRSSPTAAPASPRRTPSRPIARTSTRSRPSSPAAATCPGWRWAPSRSTPCAPRSRGMRKPMRRRRFSGAGRPGTCCAPSSTPRS